MRKLNTRQKAPERMSAVESFGDRMKAKEDDDPPNPACSPERERRGA
jgi:hypothetical protein